MPPVKDGQRTGASKSFFWINNFLSDKNPIYLWVTTGTFEYIPGLQAMEHNALSRYSTRRFLLVIGAVLAVTLFVYCKPWKDRTPEERAEAITKRISKELELSSTQIVTLTKIKGEMLEAHRADKAERDAQFKALTQLVRAETIDRAKLEELKKRHDAMRDRSERQFLDKVAELHKILTAEQRTKAADALLKYEKKFSGEK